MSFMPCCKILISYSLLPYSFIYGMHFVINLCPHPLMHTTCPYLIAWSISVYFLEHTVQKEKFISYCAIFACLSASNSKILFMSLHLSVQPSGSMRLFSYSNFTSFLTIFFRVSKRLGSIYLISIYSLSFN